MKVCKLDDVRIKETLDAALNPNDDYATMTVNGEIIICLGVVTSSQEPADPQKFTPYAGVNFITFPKEDAEAIYDAMNVIAEKYSTVETEKHREVFGDDAALALERLADRLNLVTYGDKATTLSKVINGNEKRHKKIGINTIG